MAYSFYLRYFLYKVIDNCRIDVFQKGLCIVNLVHCKDDHPQNWNKLYLHYSHKGRELLEIVFILWYPCNMRKGREDLTLLMGPRLRASLSLSSWLTKMPWYSW